MIRVVIFDLGETLIDTTGQPFPHVKEALAAISEFTLADGKPVEHCLVSDFKMAEPPVTAAKINKLFKEYLKVVDAAGLREHFEPVNRRITLSTHAGVYKPARKLFRMAVERLKLKKKVSLTQCLLITEKAEHVRAARETLGMQALQFRSPASPAFDFDDWSEAPSLIADLIDPHHLANAERALRAHLAAKHGVEMTRAQPSTSNKTKVTATVWQPITVPGLADLRDLQVSFPVEGEVSHKAKGQVKSVKIKKPSSEQIEEAKNFVRSLAEHGQIAGRKGKGPSAPTHEIETDAKGNRKLVRKRFTAF